MAQPELIQRYLAGLAAQLPGPIVEELADGLDQAYRSHLDGGLSEEGAAQAAVTEFGEGRAIVAAFTDASPARRSARQMLIFGAAVGMFWGAALVTARAWTWPLPTVGRLAFGAVLILVIGLFVAAARGQRYRPVSRAAIAGLLGMAILDASMLTFVITGQPRLTPLLVGAAAASLLRIAYTSRSLQHAIAG